MSEKIPTPGRDRTLPIGTSLCPNAVGKVVLCAWTIDAVDGAYWLYRHEVEGANSGERRFFSTSSYPEVIAGAAWRHAGLRVGLAELRPEIYGEAS